jgi:hypothetical protein
VAEQLVVYRLSKLSEEKIQKVLDKQQWQRLQDEIARAQNREELLIQAGAIKAPQPPTEPVPNVKP